MSIDKIIAIVQKVGYVSAISAVRTVITSLSSACGVYLSKAQLRESGWRIELPGASARAAQEKGSKLIMGNISLRAEPPLQGGGANLWVLLSLLSVSLQRDKQVWVLWQSPGRTLRDSLILLMLEGQVSCILAISRVVLSAFAEVNKEYLLGGRQGDGRDRDRKRGVFLHGLMNWQLGLNRGVSHCETFRTVWKSGLDRVP